MWIPAFAGMTILNRFLGYARNDGVGFAQNDKEGRIPATRSPIGVEDKFRGHRLCGNKLRCIQLWQVVWALNRIGSG